MPASNTTEPTGAGPRRGRGGLHGWFVDRRVLTKILTVTGVAAVGMAAVGVLSLVGINNLEQTRDREVGQAVPYITHLNAAALAAKAAANDERGFFIAGDVSFRDAALERKGEVDENLAAARSEAHTDDRRVVDEIKGASDAWFAALESEFALAGKDEAAAVEASMGPNRELRKVYEELFEKEIARANDELLKGKVFAATVDSTSTNVLAVLIGCLLLAAALAVYVGRQIVSPLRKVSSVLDAVAAGDLSHDVDVRQGDEVGQMADALRRATGNLRETITGLTEHASGLAAASEELSVTSQRSAEGAETGAQSAALVAGSAGTMSDSIQTVAAGTEQMGASIREIAHSTSQAVGVAERAVDVAGSTKAVMAKLDESSAKIGNVIKVITSIAEQTNLLALNATIEAARAGDAGKGFAVVAHEVKELAQETARATEDVGARIAAIQSDTAGAVTSMDEISEIIGRLNEFQGTIAAAVEEQTAVTEEMSRNVSGAAGAGAEVAQQITEVAASVEVTTVGVAETNQAADQLAQMSAQLRQLVDQFRV